jgi:hypothetical protein
MHNRLTWLFESWSGTRPEARSAVFSAPDQASSGLRDANASASAADRKSSAAWIACASTTNPAGSCTRARASAMMTRISWTEMSPRRTAPAREAVMRASAADAKPLASPRSSESGSQQTHPWRETDSNHRSLSRGSRFLLQKANFGGIERGGKKFGRVPMVRIHLLPARSLVRT